MTNRSSSLRHKCAGLAAWSFGGATYWYAISVQRLLFGVSLVIAGGSLIYWILTKEPSSDFKAVDRRKAALQRWGIGDPPKPAQLPVDWRDFPEYN